MSRIKVGDAIFFCVIAGTLTSFVALWLHALGVFCVGIFVGGVLPMLIAEVWK